MGMMREKAASRKIRDKKGKGRVGGADSKMALAFVEIAELPLS